jgi:hypothetical protein
MPGLPHTGNTIKGVFEEIAFALRKSGMLFDASGFDRLAWRTLAPPSAKRRRTPYKAPARWSTAPLELFVSFPIPYLNPPPS